MLSFGKGAPCTFQLAMALWPKSKRNGWMICRAGATRCNTLPSHWRHGKIILNSTDNSRKLKKTEENWRKVVSWCLMYLIPIDTYWHSKRKHCKQYIRVHWSSCKQENRPRTENHREPPGKGVLLQGRQETVHHASATRSSTELERLRSWKVVCQVLIEFEPFNHLYFRPSSTRK